MTATERDDTTAEKLSDNIFANVEHGEGRFDASIDVRSYGAPSDDSTEIVVTIGPMEVTIGITPEQSRELRESLKQNEQEAADE